MIKNSCSAIITSNSGDGDPCPLELETQKPQQNPDGTKMDSSKPPKNLLETLKDIGNYNELIQVADKTGFRPLLENMDGCKTVLAPRDKLFNRSPAQKAFFNKNAKKIFENHIINR